MLEIVTSFGNPTVMAPVEAETSTSFAVPVRLDTPPDALKLIALFVSSYVTVIFVCVPFAIAAATASTASSLEYVCAPVRLIDPALSLYETEIFV